MFVAPENSPGSEEAPNSKNPIALNYFPMLGCSFNRISTNRLLVLPRSSCSSLRCNTRPAVTSGSRCERTRLFVRSFVRESPFKEFRSIGTRRKRWENCWPLVQRRRIRVSDSISRPRSFNDRVAVLRPVRFLELARSFVTWSFRRGPRLLRKLSLE